MERRHNHGRHTGHQTQLLQNNVKQRSEGQEMNEFTLSSDTVLLAALTAAEGAAESI